MTIIIKKENLKTELLREYNSLKNFMKFDSTEGSINSVIEQLAENLCNSVNNSDYKNRKAIYVNHRIRKELELEKNRALSNLLLHKGSFL